MQNIKQGDEVVIIAGKDKGKRGNVLKVLERKAKKGARKAQPCVLVEGANLVKKHVKGNPNTGEKGGIVEKAAPIHLSNVQIWNAQAKKGDRVGVKTLEDGRKVRIFKSNGELVDISEA